VLASAADSARISSFSIIAHMYAWPHHHASSCSLYAQHISISLKISFWRHECHRPFVPAINHRAHVSVCIPQHFLQTHTASTGFVPPHPLVSRKALTCLCLLLLGSLISDQPAHTHT
jgi:hypothetical protein